MDCLGAPLSTLGTSVTWLLGWIVAMCEQLQAGKQALWRYISCVQYDLTLLQLLFQTFLVEPLNISTEAFGNPATFTRASSSLDSRMNQKACRLALD